METSREPSTEQQYTDGRTMSGRTFVLVFLVFSVFIAGIVAVMRLNIRPKYEAAVASSSAKAAAIDAARAAAAASAKAQEPAK